jgi:DNA invertase Pin-like site-specific DNA recombinase
VATAAQGGADQAALAAQAAVCERHCVARGYEVVARYVDVGSGTSEQRDGYRRLLDDVRARRLDVVVAADPERFGRTAPLLHRLLAAAAAAGVRVETVRSRGPIPFDLLLVFDHSTERHP